MNRIKIKDTSGIKHAVLFHYRHKDSYSIYGDFLNEFKKIIKERVNLLFDDSNHNEDLHFVFSLEDEPDKKGVLAVFRSDKSTQNSFHFSVYFQPIVDLCDYVSGEKNEEQINDFKDTVLHELIHALDYKILHDEVKMLDAIYSKYLLSLNDIYSNDTSAIFQYQLMLFFKKFRNEGIAVLGTKLLGEKNEEILSKNDAFLIFRHVLNQVIKIASILNPKNKSSYIQLLNHISDYSNQAYSIADVILLYAMNEMNLLEHAPEQYLEEIEYKNISSKLSISQKKHLLKTAVNFDLSEYIQGLLKLKFDGKPLVDFDLFVSTCQTIQKEDIMVTNFLEDFMNHNVNREKFVEIMKEILGSPMSFEEIHRAMDAMNKNKDIKDNVQRKAIQIANELLHKLTDERNATIITWALTFLLDDEDLIYDELPGLGFQDDLIVLETAQSLIV